MRVKRECQAVEPDDARRNQDAAAGEGFFVLQANPSGGTATTRIRGGFLGLREVGAAAAPGATRLPALAAPAPAMRGTNPEPRRFLLWPITARPTKCRNSSFQPDPTMKRLPALLLPRVRLLQRPRDNFNTAPKRRDGGWVIKDVKLHYVVALL